MLKNLVGECRTYTDRAFTHSHDFAQLILPLQGHLCIETAARRLELGDRHLFFLPPGCQHTFYSRHSNQFLVLDIPAFLLPNPTAQSVASGLTLPLDERWQAIRFLMQSEIQQPKAHGNLLHLFHYAKPLLIDPQLPQSVQQIHRHYQQPLTVNQLAQMEGYNVTYYCEWFKKLTGQTPTAYLQTVRLQRAKALLEHTDWSILQIAQQVGYEHHASLTRLFQQREQTTPTRYRQTCRNSAKHHPKSS